MIEKLNNSPHQKCQLHSCPKTLYNILDQKLQCPKCIIFATCHLARQKIKQSMYVQIQQHENINGQQHTEDLKNTSSNLNTVTLQSISKLKSKLSDISREHFNKVQEQKKNVLKKLLSRLQKDYAMILEQLYRYKCIQEERICNKIGHVYESYWKESVQQFQDVEKRFKEITVSLENVSEANDASGDRYKYKAITNSTKLYRQLQTMEKSWEISKELSIGRFKKLASQYKSGFKNVQNFQRVTENIDKKEKNTDLSLNLLNLTKKNSQHEKRLILQKQLDEQELLIEELQEQQEKRQSQKYQTQEDTNSMNFQKKSDITQISLNLSRATIMTDTNQQKFEQISTARTSILNSTMTNFNTSKVISTKTSLNTTMKNINTTPNTPTKNPKTLLILKNTQITKIQTHIRQLQAKNLNITNTDAKKIIGDVAKSFVKVLDLSNNKINGTLLKDINKNSIGKYLKVIKLYGNQIDKNDASIVKKVQQLKNQGVSVLF